MKYRKRPVVVDAKRWDGKFGDGVWDFSFLLMPESQGEKCPLCKRPMEEHGRIINKGKGGDIICPGDWIITEANGKRIGCGVSDFESRYMPVPLPLEGEVVDRAAKWLAAVVENGEPYDGFESMAWSEFAGGEETADAFRQLAAVLLRGTLELLGRAKKHPPQKRVPAGRETSQ